jgi:hypothetical protein
MSRWGAATPIVVLALGAAQLTACSGSDAPQRSVQNFCDTYNSEKANFQSRYAPLESGSQPQSGEAVLTDLIMGFQSLGDVTVILTKLDAVAPNDIEPDVAAVLDSWKGMQSTLGDEASNVLNPSGLLGAVLKGLLASVESGGSWDRLGNYIETNCPSGQ